MILKKIKPYMMPLAMIVGGILYRYVSELSFITPYLIAVMLFITYSNISFHEIRFHRMHWWLITIQIVASVATYLLISPFHPIIAQGIMICILAPTATSAPIITSMLGGNAASLTAYSLLSNMTIAIVAPLIFASIGNIDANSFIESVLIISKNIFLLLLMPFVCALLVKKVLPKVHNSIKKSQSISFYLWSVALVIITGKTVRFIADQDSPKYETEIIIALGALIVCIAQFLIGRRIGKRYNDTIAGGQGLGQKNTILAIWMAQTYLNPISSIGPGAYVLWQNIVNSYQVWHKGRETTKVVLEELPK